MAATLVQVLQDEPVDRSSIPARRGRHADRPIDRRRRLVRTESKNRKKSYEPHVRRNPAADRPGADPPPDRCVCPQCRPQEPSRQAALFTEDARLAVYTGDPATTEPVQVVTGRAELEAAFSGLSAYDATTHFNGQSTITVSGDTATGETYCLAHHLHDVDGVRTLLSCPSATTRPSREWSGQWLFSDRKLIIDWTDSRPSAA